MAGEQIAALHLESFSNAWQGEPPMPFNQRDLATIDVLNKGDKDEKDNEPRSGDR